MRAKKEKSRKIIRDSIQGLKKPQLARLVRRAAVPEVKRVSELLYEELRAHAKGIVEGVIEGSTRIALALRLKTITDEHVHLWLALHGTYNANAYQEKGKTLKTFSFTKKRDQGKTKEIKRRLDTSIFSRQPFQLFCRELALDYGDNMRFSAKAFEALQFYTEAELSERIRAASLLSRADDRRTLTPTDLQVATQISHARHRTAVSAGPSDISFENYVRKVLRQVYPMLGANKLAVDATQNLLNSVFSRIIAVSAALLRISKKSTLTAQTIQTAVQLVLSGELTNHAIREGTNAVNKFEISVKNKEKGPVNARAGVIFPVARLVRQALEFLPNSRISKKSCIYLAAVLEYICADLLERAGKTAQDNKKLRITINHLRNAVNTDKEFSYLFHNTLLGTTLL